MALGAVEGESRRLGGLSRAVAGQTASTRADGARAGGARRRVRPSARVHRRVAQNLDLHAPGPGGQPPRRRRAAGAPPRERMSRQDVTRAPPRCPGRSGSARSCSTSSSLGQKSRPSSVNSAMSRRSRPDNRRGRRRPPPTGATAFARARSATTRPTDPQSRRAAASSPPLGRRARRVVRDQ